MFRLISFLTLFLLSFKCFCQVNGFPNKTTFESHTLGPWSQSLNDNTDWILHTGSTPTANTGPYFAADGTQYLYLEATGNYNKIGFLDVHVDFKNVSHPFLTFQYSMYGAKMGTLKIQYSLDGVTYTDAWTKSGGQGNYWHQGAADLSVLAGQTAYIRVRGEISNHFLSDIAIDGLCLSDGGSCDPLPIELLYFEANCKDDRVICTWGTATEINTDYFVIQRTTDGINFEDVGIIQAAGNSVATINYRFEDTNPLKGKSYYRLKQYDLDCSSEAFALSEVDCEYPEVEILQNPNYISINLRTNKSYSMKLYDKLGRLVFTKQISSNYKIFNASWPRGIYIIIINDSQRIVSKKLTLIF